MLFRLPRRARGRAPDGAARSRRDLLHRRHGQSARWFGLRGIRGREIRSARGGTERGTRIGTQEYPCRAPGDRCRRGHRMGALADQGARGCGGADQPRSQPADATRVGRRGLLAAVPAAKGCMDVRAGDTSVWREMVNAMAKVEFHFDFGSPNAYLSHLVIPDIERRTGARFEYVPVLLGGVFKLTNNRSPAENLVGIRNKSEYQRLETARFVEQHGLTRFTANPFFPVNTLVLMRGAVAARKLGAFERYVDEIYRHMWADPKKMDDPDVLRAALAESGLDAEQLLALAQTAE